MSRTMALLAALALLAPACDSNTCNTVTTDLGEMCLPTAVAADRQVVIPPLAQAMEPFTWLPMLSAPAQYSTGLPAAW